MIDCVHICIDCVVIDCISRCGVHQVCKLLEMGYDAADKALHAATTAAARFNSGGGGEEGSSVEGVITAALEIYESSAWEDEQFARAIGDDEPVGARTRCHQGQGV